MSFLSRLFKRQADDLAPYRPLWHRTVELARDPRWYAEGGIADSVPGRFDAITLVLAAVLLRMEREEAMVAHSVRITELFVEDMDGQLRESGVGDLVVGKRMGKLVSVLGGRLGALREALLQPGDGALTEAVARNASLGENGAPEQVAALLRGFVAALDNTTGADILAARISLPESTPA